MILLKKALKCKNNCIVSIHEISLLLRSQMTSQHLLNHCRTSIKARCWCSIFIF